MNLEDYLNSSLQQAEDIKEHLNILIEYGNKCSHITEFGVRKGNGSTIAFLNTHSNIKLISYDIQNPEYSIVSELQQQCKIENRNWEFILANVLDIEIEDTDFLFIDTLHNYNQLKRELQLHHLKVKKFIGFHDTYTFANRDEIGNGPGIWKAIVEFLNENSKWLIDYNVSNNNGLTILSKV